MSSKRIHLIAIGGAAMHNIALELSANGHLVTGSDDEIYHPSRGRLDAAGLLPSQMGWHPEQISKEMDIVILGMHAKPNNPELLRAKDLGLPIMSYPEYIYEASKNKKRVVIAGSHGKTTTTSIVLHVLKAANIDFDYLVGAQIEGFDRMVRLSDAPLMIIEGDEYLSSPIDRRPKIHHYKPHISVITGIAWDHINVFPTFENYLKQFEIFLDDHQPNGICYYYDLDQNLSSLVEKAPCTTLPYTALPLNMQKLIEYQDKTYNFPLIGNHNQQNVAAALKICTELGVDTKEFLIHLESFTGAQKRLQLLIQKPTGRAYLDFAHAPSKVQATVQSVSEWFEKEKLIVLFELHTFSSLNMDFLPQYKGCLDIADEAYVIYNNHTLEMKGMDSLSSTFVADSFGVEASSVINDEAQTHKLIDSISIEGNTILFMSSGNFGRYNFKDWVIAQTKY